MILLIGITIQAYAQTAKKPAATTTFSDEAGNKYSGAFVKTGFTGKGRCNYASGNVYDGGWKDSVFDGQGTYTWQNGNEYKGSWKEGQQHGKGTFRQADKEKYTGDWVAGVMEGKGTWYRADSGIYYTGDWKDGVMDGEGTQENTDGTYTGSFSQGLRSGKGVLKMKNGDVIEGTFERGEIKNGKYTYAGNIGYYEGDFHNGLRHGKGVLVEDSPYCRYSGEWQSGLRKSGRVYVGDDEYFDAVFTADGDFDHGNNYYKAGKEFRHSFENAYILSALLDPAMQQQEQLLEFQEAFSDPERFDEEVALNMLNYFDQQLPALGDDSKKAVVPYRIICFSKLLKSHPEYSEQLLNEIDRYYEYFNDSDVLNRFTNYKHLRKTAK